MNKFWRPFVQYLSTFCAKSIQTSVQGNQEMYKGDGGGKCVFVFKQTYKE